MPQIEPKKVMAQSTCKIICVVYNPETTPKTAVTPSSANWTLTDLDGNVINKKDNETVTPSTSMEIFLSGNDLPQPATGDEYRDLLLTLQWVYASKTYNDYVQFPVYKNIGVSATT